jgi:hypothetical protein
MASEQQQGVVLPSPAMFDILPPLHELLSRLLAADTDPLLMMPVTSPVYKGQQPLSMHHLAGEISAIRNRIRKARASVEELPDMDRSIDEQQQEISLLQDKIAKQSVILSGMPSER